MSILASKFAKIGVILVFLCQFLLASTVLAQHPLVAEGRKLYEGAEFAEALMAFKKAAESDKLSRRDLIQLLEGCALVYFAMGQQQAFETELSRLASLEPKHQFGATVPPEVAQAFRKAVKASDGPMQLRVERKPIAGGELLLASTMRDEGDVVRQVWVYTRSSGDEPWKRSRDAFEVLASDGETYQYYAVAVGPGNAPLSHFGTRAKPMRFTVGHSGFGEQKANCVQEEPSDLGWLWFALGTGVGALVTGAVFLGVQ